MHGFQMQFKSFFETKQSNKSFLFYEGASKDPVTGSTKVKTQPPSESEEYPMGEWNPSESDEYPMGEWNPSSDSSCIAESVLVALSKSLTIDQNCSPTTADLCTTCFPVNE